MDVIRTVALSLPRSTRTSCRFPSRILIHRLNPCVINGTDMWTELKKSIGTTREISDCSWYGYSVRLRSRRQDG